MVRWFTVLVRPQVGLLALPNSWLSLLRGGAVRVAEHAERKGKEQ